MAKKSRIEFWWSFEPGGPYRLQHQSRWAEVPNHYTGPIPTMAETYAAALRLIERHPGDTVVIHNYLDDLQPNPSLIIPVP